jgi:1,2-diacylglycerol 3-beta-galactosyltransferase
VAQALHDLCGEHIQIDLVDALADYAPWPFDRLGDIYPYLLRLRAWPWAIGYRLFDGPRRAALTTRSCWPLVQEAVFRLLQDHPADTIVSCHPALNHLTLQALYATGRNTPLITLVSDLATAHPFWFAPGVSRCLVPTEEVRQRAQACGLPEERVSKTGLPVSARFARVAEEDRLAVRQRLGLETDLPVVLLVNGAEGVGAPYRLCQAIAGSGVQAQLVVIAGRNERLRNKLMATAWPLPVRSEGFVDNMHEWMRAADLLVTKAGPSTICEAAMAGLPMVLSNALPGQEKPNVDYVVRARAGVWAPTPGRVATEVSELLSPGNRRLTQMAEQTRSIAQPGAARRVAEIVWNTAGRNWPESRVVIQSS